MGKAKKATKTKAGAKRKAPAKRASSKRAAPATKTKAKPKRAAGAAGTAKKKGMLGGVAKGIAWLGDKMRSVVTPTGKKKKKPSHGKTRKAATPTPTEALVAMRNPLP